MISKFLTELNNSGEIKALEFLKENPSILEQKTEDGWDVLQLASYYNLPNILQYGLDNKPDLSSYEKLTEHPLTMALDESNDEAIKVFLNPNNVKKIDSSFKYRNKDNLLLLSLIFNENESAKIIHDYNNKLYFDKNNLNSPFLYCIEQKVEEFFNVFTETNDFDEVYDDILIQKTIQNGSKHLFERLYPLSNLSIDRLFELAYESEKPEILASILTSGDFLPGEEQLMKLIDVSCKLYSNEKENKACAEIIEYLFEINIPFSKFENDKGQSAWMLSIQNKNDFVVKKLSQTLESVNIVDKNQLTPLFYAVESDNNNYVLALLKKRANPNVKNKNQDTPLILSVKKGNKEIVDTILQFGPQLDELNYNKEHALYIAIKNRNIPIVTSLIWAGASISNNPYQEVVENQTWQIDENGKPEIFSYHYDNQVDNFIALSKLGFKLSQKNPEGDTFLIHFIKNGHLSNFKTLLQCSVNPNETNLDGNNSVMIAATKNSNVYFDLLLQRFSNIDFEIKNNKKENIIDICINHNNVKKIVAIIKYNPKLDKENTLKIFNFICKHGDISTHWDYFNKNLNNISKSIDEFNNTPLMSCVASGNINNFKFLIDNLENKNLEQKNSQNKNIMELINLIPQNEAKNDFLNTLKINNTLSP